MGAPIAGQERQLVLHADVDAFFCQVEVLRRADASLRGTPLAVQQHQDIIAVDYGARQAGVQKHMTPAEARRLLVAVGGRVVHVYCEDGARPSYRPYRETSAALMRLMRKLLPPSQCVLEQASIDEAFILVRGEEAGAAAVAAREQEPQSLPPPSPPPPPGDAAAVAGSAMGTDPWVGRAWQLGGRIRREALSQLGLRVSVGLARNKLLAKLASRAAKPDGMRALLGDAEVEAVLQTTPVSRLPGLGGSFAASFQAAGYDTAAQLRVLSAAQLVERFGLRPAAAEVVVRWARGEDPRPVQERGPPKAIQVQMSLTPVPRPAPAALLSRAVKAGRPWSAAASARSPGGAAATAAGTFPAVDASAAAASADSARVEMLMPLFPGTPEGRARLAALVRGMAGDLVARVALDRHLERRWPSKLTVQLVTHGSGGRAAAKTCSFPSPSLAASHSSPVAADADAGPRPAGTAQAAVEAGSGGARSPSGPIGVAFGNRSPGPAQRYGLAAVAAAVAPSGGGGSSRLIVGEHTFYRPGSPSPLLEAVAASSMVLCGAILGGPGTTPGPPLVQVHLTAHSFGPYGTAASAGSISHFFLGCPAPPDLGAPPSVAAAATAALGPAATAAPVASPAGGASAGWCGPAEPNARRAQDQDGRQDQGQGRQGQERPTKRQRVASGLAEDISAVGGAAAAAGALGARAMGANQQYVSSADATPHEAELQEAQLAAAGRLPGYEPGVSGAPPGGVVTGRGPAPPPGMPPPLAAAGLAPAAFLPAPRPPHPQRQRAASAAITASVPAEVRPAVQAAPEPQPQLQPLRWQRPAQLPSQVDIIALLGSLWPSESARSAGSGDLPGGESGGGGRRQPARTEEAAERMDAWLAVFGVRPLEEWWKSLGSGEV